MSKIIEIRNLSKKFQLTHYVATGHNTLVDTLSRGVKRWLTALKNPFNAKIKKEQETFWALKEICFDIDRGDRLGIIGKNGAGKSTLLKILSRVIDPSTGSVKIKGRISSLLEVGTGFHPELTGRENIFLNGAILGMSKKEIHQKFDDIVAFAEVEKFLDTPVKRFSSGMYMRLGFAIAAHLDPEILIIDEVLAVGDAKFQSKCLSKLNNLSQDGRTILFVSHDIGALSALCNKGLYLEAGNLKEYGGIHQVISSYMQACEKQGLIWEGECGDEHIQFSRFRLVQEEKERDFFYHDESIGVEMDFEVFLPSPDLILGFSLWNQRGQCLAKSLTWDKKEVAPLFHEKGKQGLAFTIPASLLYEGEYTLQPECFIFNQKSILSNTLALKLRICPPRHSIRYLSSSKWEGITLGAHWKRR